MQNDDYLKNSFKQWQEFTQAYADFAFEAAQQSMKESLALRERAGRLFAENFKQAQSLSAREQDELLQAAETWQAQAQTAGQRFARLFKTPSDN